jgi:glycine cleavage system H protein
MNVPDDLKYTETHEWLRLEGAQARIGVTDHAQAELTDVVYVELPKIGAKVKANSPAAVVESVKAAGDIYSPVTGTVVAVNEALENSPALVNTDPYGEGWLFAVTLDDAAEVAQLKDAAAYRELTGE